MNVPRNSNSSRRRRTRAPRSAVFLIFGRISWNFSRNPGQSRERLAQLRSRTDARLDGDRIVIKAR